MEVITEITSQHYVVFAILAIISAGIISVIVFKKFQKYKQHQKYKKHELLVLVKKFENALKRIQQQVDNYQNNDELSKDLEIMAISGIVSHQLGHIPRFRSWLE